MRILRARAAVVLVIAGLALVSSCAVQPLVTAAHDGVYVALGDSYAAGPGITAASGSPAGCGRLTIGANDVGFGEVLTRCVGRSRGRPDDVGCRTTFVHDGHDVLADRIAALGGRLDRVLAEIRRRAPDATVLAVGYPTPLPTLLGGCDEAPFSRADAAYLNDTVEALNDMIEQRADAAGIRYVDTASSSVAHDICTSPDLRWVEGAVPESPAAPFHPNTKGMENAADEVLTARVVP